MFFIIPTLLVVVLITSGKRWGSKKWKAQESVLHSNASAVF